MNHTHVAVALIVGVILGAIATTFLLRRDSNYEECVVSEMRGQQLAMIYRAQDVCARRYKHTPN
jgi:uncharacterized membrane-anchored protein YhcB (DUF1043 family)